MRWKLAMLAVVGALQACAPLRHSAPPAPTLPVAPASPPPAAAAADPDHLACVAHPAIDAWEYRLRHERRFRAATASSMERGAEYLPDFRRIVEATGLPPSLALLPVIESNFRQQARDNRGSGGLWQLQSRTARRFGLEVSRKRDERFHPDRATEAAALYLRFLHRRYRDWPLALAAYNCGEGRVDRALKRMPGASFWELSEAHHLPAITRDYVPRFLAVVRVVEALPSC
jgi:membrane-bound lytic murein transglycosylase D